MKSQHGQHGKPAAQILHVSTFRGFGVPVGSGVVRCNKTNMTYMWGGQHDGLPPSEQCRPRAMPPHRDVIFV